MASFILLALIVLPSAQGAFTLYLPPDSAHCTRLAAHPIAPPRLLDPVRLHHLRSLSGDGAAGDVQGDSLLDRAIASLSPGQRVRLSAASGWTVSGSFVRSDSLAVIVRQDVERSVERSAITELWVRRSDVRKAATTGGLIGGLVGGALGLTAGLACAPECASHEGFREALAPGAVGLIGGAVVGALVGALIGASTPTWVKLFP